MSNGKYPMPNNVLKCEYTIASMGALLQTIVYSAYYRTSLHAQVRCQDRFVIRAFSHGFVSSEGCTAACTKGRVVVNQS